MIPELLFLIDLFNNPKKEEFKQHLVTIIAFDSKSIVLPSCFEDLGTLLKRVTLNDSAVLKINPGYPSGIALASSVKNYSQRYETGNVLLQANGNWSESQKKYPETGS